MYKEIVIIVVLLGSCLFAMGTEAQEVVSREPVVVAGFVGCPSFETASGELSGGTAFLARLEGEKNPLLITAHHIFGPPCGLKEEVSREKLPDFVKAATLHDLVKGGNYTTKITPLALPDTIDAAVFRTTLGDKAKPYPLAKENPKKGDTIWLVASLESQNQILHRGFVVEVWEQEIKCKFDNGNLVTRGASGAPYLNANGEVVGLHRGSLKVPGQITGIAIPVEIIRKTIETALPALVGGKYEKEAFQKGKEAIQSGDYKKAAEILIKLSNTTGSLADEAKMLLSEMNKLCDTELDKANQEVKNGNLLKAVDILKIAIEKYTGIPDVKKLGKRLEDIKRSPELEKISNQIELDKKAKKLLVLAHVYEENRKYIESYKLYKNICLLFPDTEYEREAIQAVERMEKNQSIKQYLLEDKMEQECQTWMSMGINLMLNRKYKLASDYFKKIIDQYPQSKYAQNAQAKLKEIEQKK